MQLRLLDVPCLAIADDRVDLPASAPSLLIACLGCEGGWVDRALVSARFWPEADRAEAQRRLRITLYRARHWLEQAAGLGHALQAQRQRVRLDLECDVTLFRRALDTGQHALAAALHRAPLLQGLPAAAFPQLDDHFAHLRGTLLDGWRQAALQEAARLRSSGDATGAVRLLQAQLGTDLLTEDLVQALLRCAAAAGESASALATYARFEERLQSELGVEPMAETRALAHALRAVRQTPDAPAAATPRWAPSDDLAASPYLRPEPAWSRLLDSSAPFLLVHGVAGSGKSRLLAQAWPTATRWACREAWRTVPLAPVLPVLAPLGKQLRALVPEPSLRRELARLLPELADGERLPPPELGPGDVVDTLARVLPRWVDRLLVDDLQWADPATLQVLKHLRQAGGIRLVATVRSEKLPDLAGWVNDQAAELIELGPLDDETVVRWLALLSGRTAPRLAAWLQRTAGGIPLLMEQLLQALRDGGPLAGADAQWPEDLDSRVEACAAWPLPRQVRSVIQSRFEALPEELRRVLRALAVWGAPADPAALAALCGWTPQAAADALHRAHAAGWVVDGRLAHDLLRESVLQRTPGQPLRQLHDAAARLGQAGPPSERDAHRSAEHWWQAGDEAAAVAAELQAAQHDRARGLHATAVRRLHDAEARCVDAQDRSALAGLQGWLWLELGEAEQALRHGERALALADAPERQLDLRLLMAHAALERGQLAEATRLHAQAAALQPDDPEVLTLAGHLAMLLGDYPRLAAAVERLGAIVGAWPAGPDRAEAMTSQGTALAMLGRTDEAVALTREALAMARACNARHVEVGALRNLVAMLTDRGQPEEAVGLGRAALALGDYKATAVLKNNLGRALKRLQRWDEAMALFGELTADRDPSIRCYAWGHLIDIHGRRGAADAVRLAIEAGLAARERTEQGPARDMVLQGALAHGTRDDVERVDRLLAADAAPPSPLVAAARQDAARRLGV